MFIKPKERAKKGEERALRAVDIFKEYLSLGLMNMVHIFNPDTLVLGGGLVENLGELIADLEDKVKKLSESLPASCFSLEVSKAGEFLGARGALAFIKSARADIKG
jgi:glucokinase